MSHRPAYIIRNHIQQVKYLMIPGYPVGVGFDTNKRPPDEDMDKLREIKLLLEDELKEAEKLEKEAVEAAWKLEKEAMEAEGDNEPRRYDDDDEPRHVEFIPHGYFHDEQ